VTGNILFEIFYWPHTTEWWITTWQGATVAYPIERAIIVIVATILGTALVRAVRSMT
jgi:hypothetical protein